MALPQRTKRERLVAEMQIRKVPGQKDSEIRDRVKEQWSDVFIPDWSVIERWDTSLRQAAIEIAKSIESLPEKDRAEQWKLKLEDWLKNNPMPEEADTVRRLNLSRGIKPITPEQMAKSPGGKVTIDKTAIAKAKTGAQPYIDKFSALIEKEKNK